MSKEPHKMKNDTENLTYNIVENMESEDSGEVQYIYDENQMILGGHDDFTNITDLILEDGTRAMIVNGTLVTADGQTLVLQDGSDLSQYYVDENTDQILLSQEADEQFLEIISPQDAQPEEQQLQYVQQDSNTVQPVREVLYIHEDNQELPMQLAEIDSENNGVPMQVVKLENQQVIEGMEGVIDLEQFLSQQGLVQLEGGNYQYAVLKDGKFHIQALNDPTNAQTLKDPSSTIVNNQKTLAPLTELSSLDLSAARGKNINTGEPIALSNYMNKLDSKNKKKVQMLNKNENSKIRYLGKYNIGHSSAVTNAGLKNLINKKITIGKTETGQLLVGKIINVTKKTEASNTRFKNTKYSLDKNVTIKKKSTLPSKEIKKNVNALNEVINLVDDEDIESEKPSSEKHVENGNSYATTDNSKTLPVHPVDWHQVDPDLIEISKTTASILKGSSDTPLMLENKSQETMDVTNSKLPTSANDKHSSNLTETSTEQSKIVVHKKIVTKDCFEVITRTLTGLMNMESVVKKLKNKTIIIKILEKIYDHDAKDYAKNVSYCTGFMVREYKLDDQVNSFSESWKFIPDTNSEDTILEEDNLEGLLKDPLTGQNKLKRVANLTIQITVNPQGNRTTRVIINPPNKYTCRECTKSFRTNSALKVHMDEHSSESCSFNCTVCAVKFDTYEALKEHCMIHQLDDNKGMYECMECNKRFGSSLLLRRHMDVHFKPVNCQHCNKCFSNARDLKKHLQIHEPVVPEPHTVPAILKKGTPDTDPVSATPQELKHYHCHICGRQFSRLSNLQRHIEIHQGEGAMYKCAICGCSYHYVSSLTRHVVTCHVDTTNKRSSTQNVPSRDRQEISTNPNVQFLQNDQIVEMIRLGDASAENIQYVTGTMDHVTQSFSIGEGVEVLQLPAGAVEENTIIIED